MKKLILLFAGAAMVCMAYAAQTPALTINRATKAINPDGDAADWGTTWVAMTGAITGNTTTAISKAQFQATYNDDYLWIIVQSTGDATVDTDGTKCPNTYERDCIEVMLGFDTVSWAVKGVFGEGEGQFRLVRGLPYGQGARFDDGGKTPMAAAADFKVGQVDAGTTYTQEWQFPWAQVAADMKDSIAVRPASYGPGSIGFFKLEVQNADNSTGSTSGRTQQIFWRDLSNNAWDDSRTLSLVKMADKVNINKAGQSISKLSINTMATDKLRISQIVKSASIFDAMGRDIMEVKNTNEVNVSGLSAGTYFFVSNGTTLKFVKR